MSLTKATTNFSFTKFMMDQYQPTQYQLTQHEPTQSGIPAETQSGMLTSGNINMRQQNYILEHSNMCLQRELSRNLHKAYSTVNRLEKLLTETQFRLTQSESDRKKKEKELHQCRTQREQENARITAAFTKELKKLKSQVAEKEKMDELLQEKDSDIIKLMTEIEVLKKIVRKGRGTTLAEKEEVDSWRNKFNRLSIIWRNNASKLGAECEEEKAKISAAFTKKLEDLKAQMAENEKKMDEVIQDKDREISSLMNQVEDLRKEVESARAQKEEEEEDANFWKKECDKLYIKLKADVDEIRAESEEQRAKITASFTKKLEELHAENEWTMDEVILDKDIQILRLMTEVEDLRIQEESDSAQKEEKEKARIGVIFTKELEELKATTTENVKKMDEVIQEKDKEINSLINQIEDLRSEMESARAQKEKEVDHWKKEFNRISIIWWEDTSKIEAECKEEKARITASFTKELEELKAENEKKMEEVIQQKDGEMINLMDQIENLRKQLDMKEQLTAEIQPLHPTFNNQTEQKNESKKEERKEMEKEKQETERKKQEKEMKEREKQEKKRKERERQEEKKERKKQEKEMKEKEKQDKKRKERERQEEKKRKKGEDGVRGRSRVYQILACCLTETNEL